MTMFLLQCFFAMNILKKWHLSKHYLGSFAETMTSTTAYESNKFPNSQRKQWGIYRFKITIYSTGEFCII